MPLTLYRHILAEVLKVLGITTAVMVTVMAFAVAVKPLSEGLLGPADLVRFVAYSMPTLLSFVLPLSAAFATTLIFIRLSNDNELLACSAGGLSHRQVLAPIAALGLVLTLTLLILSNVVIPEFYLRASQTVQRDVLSLMTAKLQRDRVFRPNDRLVIYADHAAELPITDEVRRALDHRGYRVEKLVELNGAALTMLETRDGGVRFDATASRATAVLYRDPELGGGYVAMRMRDPVYFDPATGRLLRHALWDAPIQRLPTRFDDDPRFLSWIDLYRLRSEPHRFKRVRGLVDELFADVVTERQLRELEAGVRLTEGLALQGPLPGDRYRLHAPIARRDNGSVKLTSPSDPGDDPPAAEPSPRVDRAEPAREVVLVNTADNRNRRVSRARRAQVSVHTDPLDGRPRLTLTLIDVVVSDQQSGRELRRAERPNATYNGLTLADSPTREALARLLPAEADAIGVGTDTASTSPAPPRAIGSGPPPDRGPLPRLSGAEVADLADRWGVSDAPAVQSTLDRLNEERRRLAYSIRAIVHERAASAVSCLLLTLIGAVLSIALRGQTTLAVFFWSLMLALMTIILINTGQNLTRSGAYPAAATLGVLWLGNALLVAVAVLLYRRVARH